MAVPFVDDFPSALKETDHVVDAIFGKLPRNESSQTISNAPKGFNFSGEIREPFPSVIEALSRSPVAVTSVDAPSSWDIESGPPSSGPGKDFNPAALVSLTAPKPLVSRFKGRHFIGGR